MNTETFTPPKSEINSAGLEMTDPNGHALVVLSGGQDSTTCLFWAKKHFGRVSAVSFDYGQKHRRELEAAALVAGMSGMDPYDFEQIRLGDGILRGTSPLTDPSQPLEQYESFEQMDSIIGDRVEKTFVPMRNALFLTVAANRAVVAGAQYLVTGVCQQDNANYPDCRQTFVSAMEAMINRALDADIKVLAPLMYLSKAESILMAIGLPGAYRALAYSHTAYDGQYPPVGHDHATMLRAQGFLEAGVPDPLIVRAHKDGLMALPSTSNYTPELVAWAWEIIK